MTTEFLPECISAFKASRKCGIYKLISPNEYYYIGSSNNIRLRCLNHLHRLKNNTHPNPRVQNKFNAHPSDWKVLILEECVEDCILTIEQKYLDKNYGLELCMNNNPIAGKPPTNTTGIGRFLGGKHAPEARAKISAANIARSTPEYRKRMSDITKLNGNKPPSHPIGYIVPLSVRDKISNTLKGHTVSIETRTKISNTLRKRKDFKLLI
jgi:group I intron endonuclease